MLPVAIGAYGRLEYAVVESRAVNTGPIDAGDLDMALPACVGDIRSKNGRSWMMTGLDGVAAMAVTASRSFATFRHNARMDTASIRFERPGNANSELGNQFRIGVASTAGLRQTTRMDGRARLIERNERMNVTVTTHAIRCFDRTIAANVPMDACAILVDDAVVTVNARSGRKPFIMRELFDSAMAIDAI
jgi:hypothetical protein